MTNVFMITVVMTDVLAPSRHW